MSHEIQALPDNAGTTKAMYSALTTKLTGTGAQIRDALVYSSAYLALIAMVQVGIAMTLLSLPLSAAPLVVGLVTFAVYANDRLADADTDEVSNPRQAAFVRRHQDSLYVLASVAYGLAVALSVLGGPVALAITLLPGVFWILYASDWIPAIGSHFKRLKDVLLVNSGIVALAWAVTLTFLPLAFAERGVSPLVGVVFAYFFLGTFVNTEIPNVRDVDGDRAIDVATLPVVFGVRRTRQALYVVNLVSALILGIAVYGEYLSVALAVTLFVGLGYSILVTSALGRFEATDLLTIAAESGYLVVAAALYLVVAVA